MRDSIIAIAILYAWIWVPLMLTFIATFAVLSWKRMRKVLPIHGVKGHTHNHLAWLIVAGSFAYIAWVCVFNQEIAFTDVNCMAMHRLALYTAFWSLFVLFYDGVKFDVLDYLRGNHVAYAILISSIILGAAIVLAVR